MGHRRECFRAAQMLLKFQIAEWTGSAAMMGDGALSGDVAMGGRSVLPYVERGALTSCARSINGSTKEDGWSPWLGYPPSSLSLDQDDPVM